MAMAGNNNNEPAKLLLPYLQRADELQNHDPLVAYYCRLYAMERGLKIPQKERTKTTISLLLSLINLLEKDKKSLKLSPDHHLHLEGFALNVFAKADKQDQAGRADMNTAKTFYAASIFFEILNQFGKLEPDLEQKQKYAAWKAAEIRKALKEGRKPVPTPTGGEIDLSTPSSPRQDVEPQHAGNDVNPNSKPDPTPATQIPYGLKRQSSNSIQPLPPQLPYGLKKQTSENIQPSTPQIPRDDYNSHKAGHPSNDYQSACPSDNLNYPRPYQSQPHPQPQEPHQPPDILQNYPSQDMSTSYSYPNFQSYSSFLESSLPAASSHHPSYSQVSDVSYFQQPRPLPSVADHSSAPHYKPNSRKGYSPCVQTSPAQTCHYDSHYQPPLEKIAEAQKAARFAAEALAFDEVQQVPVAVEHLQKALEFLTNPYPGR